MPSDRTESESERVPAAYAERPLDNPNGATSLRRTGTDRDSVRAREKDAFGGIKFGSAFLGWLTTIGATGRASTLPTTAEPEPGAYAHRHRQHRKALI